METESATISEREAAMPAAQIRTLSAHDWIDRHASGSLRKSKRLGLSWLPLYREERVCHEWGWGFRMLPRTHVTFGDAIMEGDCRALTEACWHIDRLIERNPFPDSDRYEAKYLQVSGDVPEEGVGVVLRQTSAGWIPGGHIVFAVIARFDAERGLWLPAENPL